MYGKPRPRQHRMMSHGRRNPSFSGHHMISKAGHSTSYEFLKSQDKVWPLEDKQINTWIDGGRWILNPSKIGPGGEVVGSAPENMYFDSRELGDYLQKYPQAKVWSVTEAGGELYVEPGVRTADRIAYMVENPDWSSPKQMSEFLAAQRSV